MALISSPPVKGVSTLTTSDSDFIVNQFLVDAEDLALGNAIALCFVGYADFINRLRGEHGMGGRAMIEALKTLALGADSAQCALVIRQFTKFAEAPVSTNLDQASFDTWYKKLQQKHRQLPKASRKSDGEICEYLNILFFSQPSWRDLYEIRISASGVSGNLNRTLIAIRGMLEKRAIYAQIDAEQHVGSALIASSARGGGTQHSAAKVTSESNNVKRGFATLVADGDLNAAFSFAALSGMSRATADPRKAGATISNDATPPFTPIPRDAKGALTKFVPGARKCHCGGEHLHRDCPHNDMWKQGGNGKWEWIGGKGWVNGKPPAGFNRKKAGVSPVKSSSAHNANVVHIDEEAELAEQLHQLYGSGGGCDLKAQSAKVTTCECSSPLCPECEVPGSLEDGGSLDGGTTITPIDKGALCPLASASPPVDASLSPFERHLRLAVGTILSNASLSWSKFASTVRNNWYTLWCVAFVILSIALLIPLLASAGSTVGATSFGVLHAAVESTPTPDHVNVALDSSPRLPSAIVSGRFRVDTLPSPSPRAADVRHNVVAEREVDDEVENTRAGGQKPGLIGSSLDPIVSKEPGAEGLEERLPREEPHVGDMVADEMAR